MLLTALIIAASARSSTARYPEDGPEIPQSEKPLVDSQHCSGQLHEMFGRRLYGNVLFKPLESHQALSAWLALRSSLKTVVAAQRSASSNITCKVVGQRSGSCRESATSDTEEDISLLDSPPASLSCGHLAYSSDGIQHTPITIADGADDATGQEPSTVYPVLGMLCELNSLFSVECNGVRSLELHTLTLDSNVDGNWFPTQHTWHTCSSQHDSGHTGSIELAVDSDGTTKANRQMEAVKLRLVSFNVWNSNPPKWLWRHPVDRYRQYAFRMHHLGDVMRMADADIFTLQEVRLDTSLGGRDEASATDEALLAKKSFLHGLNTASDWYNRTRKISELVKYHERNMAKWTGIVNSPRYAELCAHHPFEECLPADPEFNRTVANFVSSFRRGFLHFPSLLTAQRQWPHCQIRHISAHLPGFQYVSRAGQFYMDSEAWISNKQRDEEGPAIFSKHPIVGFDYLLLSRDPNDGDDGHQRICLHAVISVPTSDGASVLVDVYTVHLSLSPTARMRSVNEILDFIASSSRGKVQIFTGDLNAEPLEPAIQKFMQSGVSVGGGVEHMFKDAWLVQNGEPQPQDSDAAVRRYAFTFPSDNPVKRIDYIMLRSDCPECITVRRTFVLGQDPMPGTEMMEDRGVGMVHDRSPIWASDHRAVATDIVVAQ